MSTLAKIIKAMIEKGRTEDLAEKIDGFYAGGVLTKKDYTTLKELLGDAK